MANDNKSSSELKEISIALRQLVNIEAYKIIRGDDFKNNAERTLLLDRLGFGIEDIASIVETTVGTVRKEPSINKSKRSEI